MDEALPTSPPPDLNAAIEAHVLPLARELNHALLRVYAHIQPPYSLNDDETYQVDLSRSRLSILYGNQTAFEADVQVLGTYNRDEGVWLWPRGNSSVRPDAYEAVFTTLASIDACRELLRPNRFLVREELAFAFAAWLAREAGCFGAYPAMFSDGLYVFLALETLTGHHGHAVRTMSCGFCTRSGEMCDQIIAVASDLGVCSECVRDFEAVAGHQFPDDAPASEGSTWPTEPDAAEMHPTVPCIACGDFGRRIFGREASLCHSCLAMCVEALGAV